jgi:hypothetical protein
VLKSARRGNPRTIASGRLQLLNGDIRTAGSLGPADLIVGCHVLYFWTDPTDELRRIHQALAPSGHLALGYQLRQHMPPVTQRSFPDEGFTLYTSDDELAAILATAGFTSPEITIFGHPDSPSGRLALTRPKASERATQDHPTQ